MRRSIGMAKDSPLEVIRIVAWVLGLCLVATAGAFATEWQARAETHDYVRALNVIHTFDRIEMSRSMCFGTCPDYRVRIYPDGRIEYLGRGFVKVFGAARGKLAPGKAAELVVALNRAQYWQSRSSYATRDDGCPAVWTDNPGVELDVLAEGRRKTVRHYYGCRERMGDGNRVYPQRLHQLADDIDRIASTWQWVGAPEERRMETNPCFTELRTPLICDPHPVF